MNAAVLSQELRIAAYNRPLDKVLTELGVEVSFNSGALSVYTVSVDKTFRSPMEAIQYLLAGKAYVCEKIGNVYVISPGSQQPVTRPPKQEFVFSGILIDAENGEPLPDGYILMSAGTVTTNEKGFFSFTRTEQSAVRLKTQYLGYISVDTVIMPGRHTLRLSPLPFVAGEVTVTSEPGMMIMQSGQRSGENRINHQVAHYMPGSGDNSVFTLLRMMPGVRASNEFSEELMVWGGSSRISFDGFTLFGMKGFNDNISCVNPYMTKDIRLMKGGYDASYGNRTGAIAEIAGIDGNTAKPVLKANVSTLTANLYGSLPVTRQSVLSVAYRQTFYNLYTSELFNPYHGGRNASSIYISPDYGFRDLNVKYSGVTGRNDRYYISLYGANDRFDFTVRPDTDTDLSASQKSCQYGGAAGYNKIWNNGSSTNLSVSFSQLSVDEEHVTITPSGKYPTRTYEVDNRVRESALKISHDLNVGKYNKLKVGGEVGNYSYWLNDTKDQLIAPAVYVTDYLTAGNFSAEAGVRADFASNRFYLLPRVSLRQKLSGNFTATASWGLYSQYLDYVPVYIQGDKIAFSWKLTDASKAMHTVAGMAYQNDGFLANAECFFKRVNRADRLIEGLIETVDTDVWGTDLFVKKNFQNISLFGSYSFLRTLSPKAGSGHELKAGGLYNLKHFVFSANYIYGKGFYPFIAGGIASGHGQGGQGSGQGQHAHDVDADESYSRLDIAATYRHTFKICKLQAGISVVNLFDTNNIKYTYTAGSNNDPVAVYSQAMPITPMIFVEISF